MHDRSRRDLPAARERADDPDGERQIAELEKAGIITLADKGYQGSTHAKVPYKGKDKPESQKIANRAHARLRGPGERANAQLKC